MACMHACAILAAARYHMNMLAALPAISHGWLHLAFATVRPSCSSSKGMAPFGKDKARAGACSCAHPLRCGSQPVGGSLHCLPHASQRLERAAGPGALPGPALGRAAERGLLAGPVRVRARARHPCPVRRDLAIASRAMPRLACAPGAACVHVHLCRGIRLAGGACDTNLLLCEMIALLSNMLHGAAVCLLNPRVECMRVCCPAGRTHPACH